MDTKHLLIGNHCINLSRINYAQRFLDDKIAIHFSDNERLVIEGAEAEAFWAFYTSTINKTKRLVAPVVQLPEVRGHAHES